MTAAGGLLVSLDVSVANALMPAIGTDFRGDGRAAVSWVITAYAIVFAATLVPAGRIADRAGRRRTYLGGLAVFATGSLACGVATSLPVLIAGRAVQGLGAALGVARSVGVLGPATTPSLARFHAAWLFAAGFCALAALAATVLPSAGADVSAHSRS